LESRMVDDLPFGIGLRGSDETAASCALATEEAPDTENRPDLVVFYSGVVGANDHPSRPLRDGFWDGSHYWVFLHSVNLQYDPSHPVDYYVSADGVAWARSGTLQPHGFHDSAHFSVWYEPGGSRVWAAYYVRMPDRTLIQVKVGTISGTQISWGPASTALSQWRTDFPTITRDSNGYCWVLGRHSSRGAGLRTVRSTTPDCDAWGREMTPVPHQMWPDSVNSGGYIVPLTNGKVYLVYKYLNSDETQGLRGKLWDGSAWKAEEIVDPCVARDIYHQGLSVVATGDRVHVAYVGADGSLKYATRDGAWGAPLLLSPGPAYGPSLSLDTATDDLYAVFSSGGTHTGDTSIQYLKGVSPYGAGNWAGLVVLAADRWIAASDKWTRDNYYTLHSNYSGDGVVFAWWVEGIYGTDLASILPARGQVGLRPLPGRERDAGLRAGDRSAGE
jgi:hypothetical protein